jgi:chaperonin GroEL (HSP60 family)
MSRRTDETTRGIPMIASVYIRTSSGEQLVRVEAYDLDPYLTLTVRGHTVALTREEARRISDALRAVALTAEERGDC